MRFMMAAQESCLTKGAVSFVMGGLLGFAFGAVMAPFEPELANDPNKTTRQKIMQGFKDTGVKSWSWGKNFAMLGGMFATTECFIEKYRAKTDIYNGVAAGCITGGALAAKGGPQAAVIGCGTFAAFSAVIDYVMTDH